MTKNSGVSIATRQAAAEALIRDNPTWGKDKINKALRAEYGVGLRAEVVHAMKTQANLGLSPREEKRYHTLQKERFTPTEAKALAKLNLTSPAMKAYRAERKAERRAIDKRGGSQRDYNNWLRQYYKVNEFITDKKIDPVKAFKSFTKEFAKEHKLTEQQAERSTPKLLLDAEQSKIYKTLMDYGFLKFEAAELAQGDTTKKAWGTAPWQEALDQRRADIARLAAQGWSSARIRAEILSWYDKGRKRSPWDFIRKEYQPRKKVEDAEYKTILGRSRAAKNAQRRTKQFLKG